MNAMSSGLNCPGRERMTRVAAHASHKRAVVSAGPGFESTYQTVLEAFEALPAHADSRGRDFGAGQAGAKSSGPTVTRSETLTVPARSARESRAASESEQHSEVVGKEICVDSMDDSNCPPL